MISGAGAFYDDLFAEGDGVAVNLASNEYSKAVRPYLLPADRMVTCEFLTYRKGKLRCLATVAKMARGRMARYIIENRIEAPEQLTFSTGMTSSMSRACRTTTH